MDRGVKIVLAALVFLVGISFALLFRRPVTDQPNGRSEQTSRLVLRGPRWSGPARTQSFRQAETELPNIKPRKPESLRPAGSLEDQTRIRSRRNCVSVETSEPTGPRSA